MLKLYWEHLLSTSAVELYTRAQQTQMEKYKKHTVLVTNQVIAKQEAMEIEL